MRGMVRPARRPRESGFGHAFVAARRRPARNFYPGASVQTCVAMQIGSPKNTAVINMTPMIDILLVLLITFMLLPNRTKGLPSEAPEPAPENQPALANRLDVVLRIEKDQSIEIDSQPVSRPG